MSNFFTRIIDRTMGTLPRIEPLIPSIYADLSAVGDVETPGLSQLTEEKTQKKEVPETRAAFTIEKDSSEAELPLSRPENGTEMEVTSLSRLYSPSDSKGDDEDHSQPDIDETIVEAEVMPSPGNLQVDETGIPLLPIEKDRRSLSGYTETSEKMRQRVGSSQNSDDASQGSNKALKRDPPLSPEPSKRVTRQITKENRMQADVPPKARLERAAHEELLVPVSTSVVDKAGLSTHSFRSESDDKRIQALPHRSPIQPTRVTIGRIEVKAVMRPEPRPAAAEPVKKASGPALSLENYLKQRDGKT